MAAHSNGDDGFTSINITPMVDIMLVLLVIFMVTTTTIARIEGLEVDRPDAATGTAVPQEHETILLTCGPTGEVRIDGRSLTSDAEIRTSIDARVAADPELNAVVSCDEDASVRVLVRILDHLRAAGVRDYAIATEQPAR